MAFNFPPYTAVFLVGAILAVTYACIIWMRRPAPGAVPFTVFALAIAEWSLVRALEGGALDLSAQVFWGRLEYLGILTLGVMWLSFSLDYAGSKWWKNPRNFLLLWIVPFLTLIVIWTNQWHNLFWTSISPTSGAPGAILNWEHGPLFWIQATYTYALIISGILILWRFAFRRPGIYRRQMIAMLIGTLIPVIGNVIYLVGLSPIRGLDLTPFSFVIAGLIYAVTIFRFRLLDIIPVARGTLVGKLPDGVLILGADGSIMEINPAAEKLMGIDKNSVMGKQVASVWSPWAGINLSRASDSLDTELVYDDKQSRFYIDISVTPLRDKRDNIVGQLVMLRDISLRRRIEQDLRESEARYAALVEQSNEGVLIIQDGIYKFANRTMAEISGYTTGEILGKDFPFAVAHEDQPVVRERQRLRNTGHLVPSTYEIRVERKDGKMVDAEVSVGEIVYNGHKAQMITVRNITERKLTQIKLQNLFNEEHRLRSSLQIEIDKRNAYTKAIVHELRTPLTAILLSSDLLKSQVKEPILMSLVQNINSAAQNLKQRIGELIEFARGEVGALKIDPTPVNIGELIRELIAGMESVAASKKLSLVSEISANIPQVMGDRERLNQVLTHLITNAFKYTERGMVTVKASSSGNAIKVQVEDTGIGIAEEDQKHLFDPYSRKNLRAEHLDGLGIGLALCKIFIELHGGTIWVDSTPGKGSMFSFTLPLNPEIKPGLNN